jgi:hypothetical protein
MTGLSPAFQLATKCPTFQPGQYDTCHRLGGTISDISNRPLYTLFDPTDPSRGVAITYTGGDACPNNKARSLKLWIECNPDVKNIPDSELVTETGACFYEIFIKSAFGCPSQCPVSGGGLCSNHGLCSFDSVIKKPRCFCNGGYSGSDCSATTSGTATTGLTNVGGVLIAVGIFIVITMAFLIFLWYRIRSLRLDPAAYSALRAGPEEKVGAYTVNGDM